jgi:hypothetical protein
LTIDHGRERRLAQSFRGAMTRGLTVIGGYVDLYGSAFDTRIAYGGEVEVDSGGAAPGYAVTGDGHGGTLIETRATLFAQAAAAFAPATAAKAALISAASPAAQTPFAHAASVPPAEGRHSSRS